MIQCPKCAQSLPDWAQVCQFCQSDLKSVPRPKAPDQPRANRSFGQPAKWIYPAYYIVSAYYVISGLRYIVSSLLTMNATTKNVAGQIVSDFSWIGLIVGGITLIIGIGLLAKVEFIRGIVNFFCFLQIAAGLLGIVGTLLGGMFVGPRALIFLIFNVLDILTAAAMIYLIGETD